MRVAITGAGCVTPIGVGVDAFLDGWHGGMLGITQAPWSAWAPIPLLAAPIATGFDAVAVLGERVAASTDRCAQYAIAAAEEALAHAGLDAPGALEPTRTAVVDGTAMGGLSSMMLGQHLFDAQGVDGIPPRTMLAGQSNMAAAQIAIRHDLHGPIRTVTTACASALDALGAGVDLLASGRVDVVICGGSDSAAVTDVEGFVPVFSIAGRVFGMETPELDPSRAVLPFDVTRRGIVFGEGAAWFVLETAGHAEARGADPLGWVLGVGSSADGYHPSSPEPSGRWQAHAMELALADAGLGADRVDVVMAHATGTPKGDLAEARALEQVFPTSPPVTALKGHTGHTGGSSGAMSVLAALDVLRTGRVEAVLGTTEVDPDVAIDVVVGAARTLDAGVAMVNAFGFGGQNSSIVIARTDDVPDDEQGVR
ncbi:MAG: beta-ketoacyl-[acyl-carrier-protein] synthase family protein [Acidimicrobiales bacterium]